MRQMKDSGIEWIGAIPANWDIHPVYFYFSERKNKNIFGTEQNLLSLSYGNVIRKDINTVGGLLPESFNTYNIIEENDIVIRPTDLQNDKRSLRTGLCKEHGIITSAYIALKPIRSASIVNASYVHYLLHTYDIMKVFYNMGNGVRQGLNFTEFSKLMIFIPPIEEQKAIADYLDILCADVDSLVADIQAQIESLEQYKRSVITEAVTKGLNLDAEMKDSGVQWIGMMPSHWDCQRGKYILRYLQKPVRDDDGVITCFRDGEVTLRSNRREEGFTMADKEIGYQGIDVGDLVVHGMDGFAGAIGISDSRGKASPVLNVLETKQNKRYIMYYLRSMAYNDVFVALATGIRVRSCDLRWNKLAELLYPLPPVDEQEAIVEYIDSVLERTNAVIADKKQQIETIEEYKKSLIFEYVTGKKEVNA
ncbi:MAG: restriction endonuclease subunit S [Oscillospiraceae bacterium]|nr:restriction endonuclease subunit S [Oscillospiraceae bacterium]